MDQRKKMIDEYIRHTKESKLKYGEKTFVCLQGGDFYEIFGYSESDEQFNICRDILCIRVAQRNKTDNSGFVAGYPMHSGHVFEAKLLSHGYTVVYVTQENTGSSSGSSSTKREITRKVTRVCSPGCNMSDPQDTQASSMFASILVEYIGDDEPIAYLCLYDGTTGKITIEHVGGVSLDHCSMALYARGFNEVLLTCISDELNVDWGGLKNGISISRSYVHCRSLSKKNAKSTVLDVSLYQDTALNRFFSHHRSLYQDIFSNLDLQDTTGGDIGAMILLLEFLESRGEDFVKRLPKPVVTTQKSDFLMCYHGVFEKLQIHKKDTKSSKKDCLISCIKYTRSAGGARCLRSCITKPLTSVEEIRERHRIVGYFVENPNILEYLKKDLMIVDVKRYERSMAIQKLNSHHIPKLIDTLNKIMVIKRRCEGLNYFADNWDTFVEFVEYFTSLFNLENLNKSEKESGCNIFAQGIVPELDTLFKSQESIQDKQVKWSKFLSNFIEPNSDTVQLKYTEKEGYYYTTTLKRVQKLEAYMKTNKDLGVMNIKISKNRASYASINFPECSHASQELVQLQKECLSKTRHELSNFLGKTFEKYSNVITTWFSWVEHIDMFYSFANVAREWNYVCPQINDSQESSIDVKGLRHPIIEQIMESVEYIPNDVCLNADSSILLYGVNSVGKSSLMKSIGLCIIMAQAGMWVPAKSCSISPYTRLFLRIGNNDSLLDGHSSFTCEMREAHTILRYADEQSMVLADEFCASTENDSATVLVASTLEMLGMRRSSYLFATHLFQLLEMDSVVHLPGLFIKHLEVHTTKENQLVFLRKLVDGPPERRDYGLSVCKKICTIPDFIKRVERNTLLLTKNTQENTQEHIKHKGILKRSRYNAKLLVEHCSFCGYKPSGPMDLPLETHHISFQCTANSDGFIEHYHKHKLHNLVVTCKPCHIQIHCGKIHVKGYIHHENGPNLEYQTRDEC